jgi:hypothetical protein
VVTTDKLSALAATTSAELAGVISDETGSGALVFATSPTLVSPALGAATATSISASGTVTGSNLSGTNTGDQTITLTGGVTGSGTGSFAATVVTNANLTGVITSSGNATSIASQTGTGTKFVVDTSPTLVTPILGTPQSGTLTSCTGLPISTGVSGLGTGVATALAVNTGSAGAPVLFNGALGTPSSGTVTNLTGTASININGTVGATTPSTVAATTLTLNSATSLVATLGRSSNFTSYVVNGASSSFFTADTSANTGWGVKASSLEGYVSGAKVLDVTSTGLNSTAIGATTPSTGAFTALSASGDVTLAATSNLVANKSVLIADGTAGTATGAIYFINDTDTGFYRAGGNTLGFMGNGASLGTWSPTGLAVTGALSSTGETSAATFASNRFAINSNPVNTASTAQSFARFQSTGADFYVGTESSTGGSFFPGSTAYAAVLYNAPATPMHFYTGGTIRATITSGGNVGIGTTSPGYKLDVNGSVSFRDAGGNDQQVNFVPNKGVGAANSAGFGLSFRTVDYTPGAASSNIYWDGGTGYFTLSTSARKYKRNIVAVTDEQLDKALLLKPSYYQRNEHDYFEYGFIAEEVNEIGLDEFVTRVEGEISGLNYEKMVTLAIGLIQRQAAELQSLRARVAALESK